MDYYNSKTKVLTVTGINRVSAKLRRRPEDVPMREARKQIRIDIETLVNSHTERGKIIRDPNALYEISCLLKALNLLSKIKDKKSL